VIHRVAGPYRKLIIREPLWGPKTLGDELFAMRQRLGETQAQFARHFAVCLNTYRKWENRSPPQRMSRLLVKLMLRNLNRRASDRARWRAEKARQRAAAGPLPPKALFGDKKRRNP
jgi:hypothetical protein